MQAFLWRHLVPASDLLALTFDPANEPSPRRPAPVIPSPPPTTNTVAAAGATNAVAKPKFTKQQITNRLRQLKLLYEEELLTDEFYRAKVAECETSL